MPSLTIKDMPDDLIVRLRYRVEQHRRSVNSEVIVHIEEALGVRTFARSAC